eukprot:TRINITY_DN1239_c0_g1_i3.p1 TRINITY_DN1239_c0_g1~~TRINITY_DN1239_c0_g1_i3.p1  ORF type:complete len:273 (-),score=56.32 TRINITY_DN1239_c0_g1_i3:11-829(-)
MIFCSLYVRTDCQVRSWFDKKTTKHFNARSETVKSKSLYSSLLSGNRCIVIADGYYEWHTDGQGNRQPYFITSLKHEGQSEDSFIRLAGLYDKWVDKETGETLYSYTIITRRASHEIDYIHERMPTILTEEQAEIWLNQSTSPEDAIMLISENDISLQSHPVSSKVGNIKNDSEDNIKPIKLSKKPNIKNFFGAQGASPPRSPIKKVKTEQKSSPVKKNIKSFFKQEIKNESKDTVSIKQETEKDIRSSKKRNRNEEEPEEHSTQKKKRTLD